ncbi:MAG TPA: response regulator [Phycisphaeraceae bacterium]|nr:response regulator [Phycisphaeraceae bacterium]
MAKRRAVNETQAAGKLRKKSAASIPGQAPISVLILAQQAEVSAAAGELLRECGARFWQARTLEEAESMLKKGNIDTILLDGSLSQGTDARKAAASMLDISPSLGIILLSSEPNLDEAMLAFEIGAIDYIPGPFVGRHANRASLVSLLGRALARGRNGVQREKQVQKLKKVCRRLNDARREMTTHFDSLCNDMVNAYQDMNQQINRVTLASEFRAMVRQELDIESCLRNVLEFILTISGPTNAAVFLPSNSMDFSLGAYVNYDLPRDSLDVLLDHLADVVPGKVQDETRVLQHRSYDELYNWLGDDAAWLEESHTISLSCRHEDECLAVVILFRDGTNPFAENLADMMATVAPIFAEQLARIIRVHNRTSSGHEWHGFDYDDDFSDGETAY